MPGLPNDSSDRGGDVVPALPPVASTIGSQWGRLHRETRYVDPGRSSRVTNGGGAPAGATRGQETGCQVIGGASPLTSVPLVGPMQEFLAGGPAASTSRLVGLSLLMFAVGFLVCGVLLLTTCQATTVVGEFSTTVGCSYPFQWDGLAFLYSAGLISILAAFLIARSLQSVQPNREEMQVWYVRMFFAVFGVSALFVVALLFY